MRRRHATVLLLGLALLPGCVYYNGVYNAKRLTREAEQAEREGRRVEAQGLYAQAVVKAESVLARHPDSDWADDARFYRGNALARNRACDRALADLELVATTSPDPELAGRAQEVLAGCYLEVGRPRDATLTFAQRWASADSATRARLAPQFVAALRQDGRADEAAPMLEAGTAVAAEDRVAVYASLDRDADYMPLLDSLVAAEARVDWVALVESVAQVNPALASEVTDRLAGAPSLPPAVRFELRVAEARRALPTDTARARAQYQMALAAAPEQGSVAPAQAGLVQLALVEADTADLNRLADSLMAVARLGGPTAVVASRQARSFQRIREVRDSLAAVPELAQQDLWSFLLAELVRDSVGATRAAGSYLEAMSQAHPESPYAAKALLAAAFLKPDRREDLVASAFERYPASPYVLAIQGQDVPGFRALEDSLRNWTAAVFRRRAAEQRGPRPNATISPDDLP